jgi:peptidyl-prolyl cis-trans isomerase B (cyclophilin B)
MAHAGKDTGGSQWFIAHRRLPRLDAGYTIFGELVAGDEVLAALRPGDVVLEVLLQ